MDDGMRLAPDSPRFALQFVPRIGKIIGVQRFIPSAHVALGFKLSGAFRQHRSQPMQDFDHVALQRDRVCRIG